MSTGRNERSFRHLYEIIRCPCGLELRVKRALAGTEVRCWGCRQMVLVPLPRGRRLMRSGLGKVLADLIDKKLLVAIVSTAAVVTGLLVVSGPRVPLAAAVALLVAAFGYGELIRRGGAEPVPSTPEGEKGENAASLRGVSAARLVIRALASTAMGLALAAPWLLTPRDINHAPRLSLLSLGLGTLAAVLLPMIMFLAFATNRQGPPEIRGAIGTLARHPRTVLTALALFPLGVVFAEAITVALNGLFGWLPFVLLELFPDPRGICQAYRIPCNSGYDLGGLPDLRFFRIYGQRLGEGYSLTSALPHSLGIPRFQYHFPWGTPGLSFTYLVIRLLETQLVLCVVFATLALQARWLGLIPTLDDPRTEANPDAGSG